MTNGQRIREMGDRITTMEHLLDKLDRSLERVELVTIVREPNTGMSADAYNGLRKQIIAAVGERGAHLHQLAQFDSALSAGATREELQSLVREWLGQAGLETTIDASLEGAFEVVGPEDAPDTRVIRAAYVDLVTGRVVRAGVVERFNRGNENDEPTADAIAESAVESEPAEEPSAAVTAGGVE